MAASITVAVRVRPANTWEAERLPMESPNDSIFMGDGHLASSPHKIASPKSLRPIVQVMDDKVLIFDPKDPITSRAFEQKGFLPPGSKRYKDHRYTFDRVFGEDARQLDVYEDTTRPLLDGLLDGFNATVFAYGVSSLFASFISQISPVQALRLLGVAKPTPSLVQMPTLELFISQWRNYSRRSKTGKMTFSVKCP
jgi:Kinesin motor domain